MAAARKSESDGKQYRVIGKDSGASVDGVITCYVNGIQYKISSHPLQSQNQDH